MKKRIRMILIVTGLVIVTVAFSICVYLKNPQYVGSFSSNDYVEQIEIGAKPTYTAGSIKNYMQAGKIGVEVINKEFPITQERTAWYNFEFMCEVYRDEDSQLWLVYIMPRDSQCNNFSGFIKRKCPNRNQGLY